MLTEEKKHSERERLLNLDPFLLLEYIQSSIEILMDLNAEEKEGEEHKKRPEKKIDLGLTEEASEEPMPKGFEQMLQKLESEVRNHIRVEQQLKLQLESQQFRVEETVRKQYEEFIKVVQAVKTGNEMVGK